jgi:pullulanase
MLDSTNYWMEEYNLDGFRFDLMGLHDTDTMQAIEKNVHALNPQALLYGEGWTMMQNSYKPGLSAATQGNINKIVASEGAIGAIAVFNDIIRTGLKQEDNDKSTGYLNGNADSYHRDRVLFGILGGDMGGVAGWRTPTHMVVNYMSAHDGCTFWDKLTIANGNASKESRLAMNRLGATIIFASRGIVFFQAGEEMLRSKPKTNKDGTHALDPNSYKSSDETNNLKWNTLKPGSDEYDMFQYYAGLTAIRTKIDIFTNATIFQTYAHGDNSGLSIKMEDGKDGKAYVIVNPGNNPIQYKLDGTYSLICNGTTAGVTAIGNPLSGTISVPAGSAYILVTSNLLPNN